MSTVSGMLVAVDGETLHEIADRTALGLPAVTKEQPFGEGAFVYKVVGKMFAMTFELDGALRVNLKCAPPHGAALVRDLAEVAPAWHMNKRHWIMLTPGSGIDEPPVEDLVANAYELVVQGLPRAKRPYDPARRSS